MVRQQESGLKIREEQPGDKVSVLQPGRPMAWDLSHQEVTECLRASRMCKTSGSTDPTDQASFGEEEDDGSMKLKEHVGWWEAELNENERRDFPSGPEVKRGKSRIGQCAGVKENLEANVRVLSGRRGTGVLSHAAEQDDCLLHDLTRRVRVVKSAGRMERLLGNERSFGELWRQKSECVIPCDKQLCNLPTLSEQESSQT